jgi:hypothetical protein
MAKDTAKAADPAPEAAPVMPDIGVVIKNQDDGTATLHGIEQDGSQHQIVLPANHGALLSFKAILKDWMTRLGERAISWDKIAPADAAAPGQVVEPANPEPPATLTPAPLPSPPTAPIGDSPQPGDSGSQSGPAGRGGKGEA